MDRPAQFYGTAASGATNGNTDAYGNVQFSNPWSGPAGARAGAAVNPTSAPYGLPATTMAPQSDLSALRAPLRQNSVSTSFDNLALTAPLVSRSMSSQSPLYATDNFPTAGYGTTYGDTQAATAATASPSAGATYAAINGYGAYDNGSNQKLYSLPNLSSLPEDHRRLSHASLASSSAASSIMDSPLDPLRQRQSSLVDYTRGSLAGSYPSAEMDSARGMVHLSQNATRFSIPNGHRSSSSASSSSYYPHSTSSSISSASSYPYYGAGSIDSGTDMTGLGLYDDPSRPSLPRPHGMLHTMNHGGYPATQQQMMHSFNSKIQQSTTKKHKCKVCDKRFTRPSSLQTHMYSHTGEKPFACEVEGCGRQFSVVSNLRRHRKVHKGHSDTETVSNAGSV